MLLRPHRQAGWLWVLIAIAAAPAWCADRPSGVSASIAGATICASRLCIELPPKYKVIDLAVAESKLYVTAYADSIHGTGSRLYHAEVWAFNTPGADRPARGFADRQVLYAVDTADGEPKQLPLRSVPCSVACAVYVEGWENGHTLLYNSDGVKVEVPWPDRKGNEPCCLDYVEPLAWLEDHSDGAHYKLLCQLYYEGDMDPYLMTYDWQTKELAAMPLAEGLKQFGTEAFNALVKQTR